MLMDYRIACSLNGWTDGELAVEWMVKDFNRQTKEKADGKTQVLLMDRHSSHYTLELLEFSRANNIIILGYPLHCTHALQWLDVVCFAQMKEAWKDKIHKFEELDGKVTKGDFTEVFGKAFLIAFTEPTIRAAFEKTGIYPFNPEVITAKQLKPSEPTSTVGSLPIPMPSPVRAIMAAFNHRDVTTFDSSPDARSHAPLSSITNPSTPTPAPRIVDCAIDPTLFTPMKCMCIMTSALAGTSTGSFLVRKEHITSVQSIANPVFKRPILIQSPQWNLLQERIPGPDQTQKELVDKIAALTFNLDLARQQIAAKDSTIEASNAQLAVQGVYNKQLNEALNTKENKKETDRTQLAGAIGGPRVWTEDKFVAQVASEKVEREKKAADKVQRQLGREQKKAAKAATDDIWKGMVDAHKVEVDAWTAECAHLRVLKVKVKDLPKKPKGPAKPKAVVVIESDPSSDDDNE